jgi:pimeloyl-ACP methyl ester carboxylesterase
LHAADDIAAPLRIAAMGEPTERALAPVAADGVQLSMRLMAPERPAGVLVLCHGLTTDKDEHGGFVRLRDAAARAGLAVARFDFRAHGESGGANEDLRLQGMRDDVDAVLAAVDAELGGALPVVPVGLSFGGAAAVHAASTHPRAAGLVLWYAVLDYGWNYGETSPVPFTQHMRASRSEDDPAWSAMPVVDGYHFPHAILEDFETDTTCAALGALEVPVLAFHGSRDSIVGREPAQRLAREHPHITLRTCHGAGHGFVLWLRPTIRSTVRFALRAARAAR